MTTWNRPQGISPRRRPDDHALKGPGPENQFVQLRPRLRERELIVLSAVSALPAESQTPSAAVAALVRQGMDIPYSTLATILRRLERKGAIRLQRKRP